MAAAGGEYSACDYLDALDGVAALHRSFDALSRSTISADAGRRDHAVAGRRPHPTVIDGRPVGPRGHAVFTPIANALGLPAMSLPCIVDDGALPVGLQVIAARDRDKTLLNFAREQQGRLFAHRWPGSV